MHKAKWNDHDPVYSGYRARRLFWLGVLAGIHIGSLTGTEKMAEWVGMTIWGL